MEDGKDVAELRNMKSVYCLRRANVGSADLEAPNTTEGSMMTVTLEHGQALIIKPGSYGLECRFVRYYVHY